MGCGKTNVSSGQSYKELTITSGVNTVTLGFKPKFLCMFVAAFNPVVYSYKLNQTQCIYSQTGAFSSVVSGGYLTLTDTGFLFNDSIFNANADVGQIMRIVALAAEQ